MAFSLETAKPLNALAEVLLLGSNTLSPGPPQEIRLRLALRIAFFE